MEQATAGEARKLAQDLVEILGCYEEELMAVESEAPQMSRLRRAVGIVIAEAYYLITDDAEGTSAWSSPDGPAGRAG